MNVIMTRVVLKALIEGSMVALFHTIISLALEQIARTGMGHLAISFILGIA